MKDHVDSNWQSAILVCRKCSKRLDGGFGPDGDERLAKALRKHLSIKKGRKGAAGIIEVDCLGICPKQAVTVVNGADAREWLLVRPGADLDDLAGQLGLLPGKPVEVPVTTAGAAPVPDGDKGLSRTVEPDA